MNKTCCKIYKTMNIHNGHVHIPDTSWITVGCFQKYHIGLVPVHMTTFTRVMC